MIQQHEIDGVPVLFAAGPGPARAGLVFRVGTADEPLARSGLTRLLTRHARVDTEHTSFLVSGDLVTPLAAICTALTGPPPPGEPPPVRVPSVLDRMAVWRHGAVGHGVAGFPEPGRAAITEGDLRSWAARYFTRDNAVLWMTGREMPTGLRLPLPAGVRRPVPEVSSALPVTPAWFNGPAVAWTTVVPRGPAALVLVDLLERSMLRELRAAATIGSHRLGRDKTLVAAYGKGVPLDGLIDVVAAFGAGRIDRSDLALSLPERAGGGGIGEQALDLLAGLPARPPGVPPEVTFAEVVAVARKAYAAGLLMVPEGVSAQWAGYVTAPRFSDHAVTGTVHRGRGRRGARLIVGGDGVSLVVGERPLTVRFDACALYRAWPDGARQLVGNDAITVHIEPDLYRDGRQAIAALDARIPPGLRVDEPARAPEVSPRPRFRLPF